MLVKIITHDFYHGDIDSYISNCNVQEQNAELPASFIRLISAGFMGVCGRCVYACQPSGTVYEVIQKCFLTIR